MIIVPSLAILLYTLYTPTTSGHTLPRQAASPPPPPGANPETMGGQSAQAMNIGTGGSQQDKYSSSYSTPNYTQYTNSDYKGEYYVLVCTGFKQKNKEIFERKIFAHKNT